MTKEDIVVVWGGTNNIAKNESEKGLVHILNFVKQRKHTNIIVVNAPKRHDLPTTFCVNSEVTTYNRKLYKSMKPCENVKIRDSDMHREHFTRHGLHMNAVGKELIAQGITDHIRETFVIRQTPPIILKWKQDLTDSGQEGDEVERNVTCSGKESNQKL